MLKNNIQNQQLFRGNIKREQYNSIDNAVQYGLLYQVNHPYTLDSSLKVLTNHMVSTQSTTIQYRFKYALHHVIKGRAISNLVYLSHVISFIPES